jgi:lysine-specific demethylase/histidyl-hydroxylase NO66
MMAEPSLAWLLEPIGVETFLDEMWGTTHHHLQRGSPGYFAGLFGSAKVEEFLDVVRPPPAVVRLVRGDRNCDPDCYRMNDGALDLVRIRNEFAAGYSIVLNSLDRYLPAIAALAHGIEVELNFETQVNAYVTPPGSQAFLPHYDDHDVLILQIEGSKTWFVYEDADVAPRALPCRAAFSAEGLPEPLTLRLEAGDVLYIPRGRVHAAEANAESSIHLTVGIHAPTVKTLLSRALDALSLTDDRVLGRLPPRHLDDPAVRAQLDHSLQGVIAALADPEMIAEGLGAVQDALVRRGRCHSVGRLVANAVETKRIDGETVVAKYRPLYSRVLATGEGVALQFGQSLVSAGADHRAAMLFLSRSTMPFRVGDLPELDGPQQIELARKLVVDGFLVPPALAEARAG